MCLGTVAKVIEVHRDGRSVVEHDGRTEEVLSMTITDDDLEPGEWVIIHSGFALERISEAQAAEALAIRSTDTGAPKTKTNPARNAKPKPKEATS